MSWHYLVVKTTGETTDLSSEDPLWRGQVLYVGDPPQIIDRLEPESDRTIRVVCREPTGPIYELMLLSGKPLEHDRLDYWEGDESRPPQQGDEIRWGHDTWRVESISPSDKEQIVGRLNCRRPR